jgi:hypothetical protein
MKNRACQCGQIFQSFYKYSYIYLNTILNYPDLDSSESLAQSLFVDSAVIPLPVLLTSARLN